MRSIQKANTKSKVPKLVEYDRDIICLPNSMNVNMHSTVKDQSQCVSIPIPRSEKTRNFLAANGLIGKIHFDSTMSEEDLFMEVRSVFSHAMGNSSTFAFDVLQTAGGCSKTLTVPSVSSSFHWTASALVGKNLKMPIYIMAIDELKVKLC